jgi:hypothetical protein
MLFHLMFTQKDTHGILDWQGLKARGGYALGATPNYAQKMRKYAQKICATLKMESGRLPHISSPMQKKYAYIIVQ